MITFRPLTPAEFPAFRAYFVPDYALDLVANAGLSPQKATDRATADLTRAFPDGPAAAGQDLSCILGADGQHIGYVWTEAQAQGQVVFVQDFHILPQFQGLGFAKAAMAALEVDALAQGARQIKLRVAPENAVALHVYTGAGFRISGIQMIKPLTPTGAPL